MPTAVEHPLATVVLNTVNVFYQTGGSGLPVFLGADAAGTHSAGGGGGAGKAPTFDQGLLPAVQHTLADGVDANLLLPAVDQTFGDAPNPLAGLLLPAVDHSAFGLLLPAV